MRGTFRAKKREEMLHKTSVVLSWSREHWKQRSTCILCVLSLSCHLLLDELFQSLVADSGRLGILHLWCKSCRSQASLTRPPLTIIPQRVVKVIFAKSRITAAHGRYSLYPILYNGPSLPLKIVPSMEGLAPSNTWFLGPTNQRASRSVQPFLQGLRSWQTDWPTDRQTDHTNQSLTIPAAST